MTVHELVTKVAAREGGAVNLNIAEVSEVVRHTLAVLSELPPPEREQVLAAAGRRERARGVEDPTKEQS